MSEYDTKRRNPVWVAHVDTRESAAAAEARTGGKWNRKQYKFRPDANVVTFSIGLKLQFVTDDDYTNATPKALSPVNSYTRISRGHMASNLEMKGHGDETDGVRSQTESFSFANVAPQMQALNSPLWSQLEEDCLRLARDVGRVAVITGPVFRASPGHTILQTDGDGNCRVPIPTHFFKILIATVDERTVALGFLVPHRSDLGAEQRFEYAVPIRDIEKAAGINFMPEFGRNDAMETKLDAALLARIRNN